MSRRFIASWEFAAGVVATLGVMTAAVVVGGNTLRAGSSGKGSATFSCTVTKVHDGDGPIWCAEGLKVRLTAISARELDGSCAPGHPCPSASGQQAQQALWRLARGQRLRCEATGTSYRRVTAWCWRPVGVELNCAMLKSGTVVRWDKFDRHRRMCR